MGSVTSRREPVRRFRWAWELVCQDGKMKKTLVKRYLDDRDQKASRPR